MKILYINALYHPMVKGGAEISLKLIVEGMQARGHEVAVLSMVQGEGFSTEMVDGVKVYRAGLKNIYWPFTDQKQSSLKRMAWHYNDRYNARMRKYVHEALMVEKPDVVSCHNLVGWSVAVWDEIRDQSIPVVQVLHDMYLLCANSEMYKNEANCTERCLSCQLLRSSHLEKSLQISALVGISKSIIKRFEKHGYFKGVPKHTIHNTREIASTGSPRVRQPATTLKVGYLGTLLKKKGIEWLIDSFMQLNIDATLTIAGTGHKTYEDELKERAADSRIKFIGHTDPQDFFQMIDVLVVPSLWEEPLGMVAIESLANHLPVIANRRGGLQETVIHNTNGLLCNDEEADSLARALEKLYHDHELYNKLSQSARQSVAQILDSNRMINAYESVYHSVM